MLNIAPRFFLSMWFLLTAFEFKDLALLTNIFVFMVTVTFCFRSESKTTFVNYIILQ